jgi:ribosomal protein S4
MTKIKNRYRIGSRRNNRHNNKRYNDRWQIIRMSLKKRNFFNLNTVFLKKKHRSSKYAGARDTKWRLIYKAKQEMKKFYGDITERKLRNISKLAFKNHQPLITELESRLDSLLFRLNWATSVYAAKQLISHGQIYVNGREVTIPGYILKKNDILSLQRLSLKKNSLQRRGFIFQYSSFLQRRKTSSSRGGRIFSKGEREKSLSKGNLCRSSTEKQNRNSQRDREIIGSSAVQRNSQLEKIKNNIARTQNDIKRYKRAIKKPWFAGGIPKIKKGRLKVWYIIPLYLEVDYRIFTVIMFRKPENMNLFITKPLIRDIIYL